LIIRADQVKTLERGALLNFENRMIQHLKQFAPRHAEVLGTDVLRNLVKLGIARAETYKFSKRGPVQFYLELMFMLGSDFDTDPQLPWAHDILKEIERLDEMARADLLHARAMQYLDSVVGADYEYEKEAMVRVTKLRFDDLPPSSQNVGEKILAHLKSIYPQKFAYVGESPLRALVNRAAALAGERAIASGPGISIVAGLMFALGHGVAADPQYPWVANTLNDTSEPKARIERLFRKTLTFLERGLANLNTGAS
jgi:hypothetical protein